MNLSLETRSGAQRIHSLAGCSDRILVVNCGSSSLKYRFYRHDDESCQMSGVVERIGMEGTLHRYRGSAGEMKSESHGREFKDAFRAVTNRLKDDHAIDEITVIVHRVVHGGEKFTEAVLITDNVLLEIEALSSIAPLHNPVNALGIREMRRIFPHVPHVAVFDTAFHHTLPPQAFLYGVPYELFEKHGIRRYGFHGTSHRYVTATAAEFMETSLEQLRIVSCHLGNGASICAVQQGRSVDISMGFTPSEGLLMGTRCGDIDPGLVTYLQRVEGLTIHQIEHLLNRKSGLLGLSGISSDMREVLSAAEGGHERARLALEVYCYRLQKYISAYAAALGGLDLIIFTGGVGEGSSEVRARTLKGLKWMGVEIDQKRNRAAQSLDKITGISADGSKVKALVVPTDEERMMAIEAVHVLKRERDRNGQD